MWSFRRPTQEQVRKFLATQAPLPFSYPEVGATRGPAPAGYSFDHNRVELGAGREAFEAACEALRAWRMFHPAVAEVIPTGAPLAGGTPVAVLARAGGVWWLNAARVVYVFDEPGPPRLFGFAYGTLPDHVERGEERFTIEWGADDRVWYDLRAFSRPAHWLARLGYPLARRAQKRFARASLAAMKEAVAEALRPVQPAPPTRG